MSPPVVNRVTTHHSCIPSLKLHICTLALHSQSFIRITVKKRSIQRSPTVITRCDSTSTESNFATSSSLLPTSSTQERRQKQQVVHIFWDLDNIRPATTNELSQLCSLIVATSTQFVVEKAHTKASTTSRGGEESPFPSSQSYQICPCIYLSMYANPTTQKWFGSLQQLHLAIVTALNNSETTTVSPSVSLQIIPTDERRQSVDLALRTDMVAVAKALQSRRTETDAIIVCVSDDSDFVQALEYCYYLGCGTVSIGEHWLKRRSQKRQSVWATSTSAQLYGWIGKNALARSSAAAVTLVRPHHGNNTLNTHKRRSNRNSNCRQSGILYDAEQQQQQQQQEEEEEESRLWTVLTLPPSTSSVPLSRTSSSTINDNRILWCNPDKPYFMNG